MAPDKPHVVIPNLPKIPQTQTEDQPVAPAFVTGPEAASADATAHSAAKVLGAAVAAGAGLAGVASGAHALPPPPPPAISQIVSDHTVDMTKTCTVTIHIHGDLSDEAYKKLSEGLCSAAPAAKADAKTGIVEIAGEITAAAGALDAVAKFLKWLYEQYHPPKTDPPAAPAPTVVVVIGTADGTYRHAVASAAEVPELENMAAKMKKGHRPRPFPEPNR